MTTVDICFLLAFPHSLIILIQVQRWKWQWWNLKSNGENTPTMKTVVNICTYLLPVSYLVHTLKQTKKRTNSKHIISFLKGIVVMIKINSSLATIPCSVPTMNLALHPFWNTFHNFGMSWSSTVCNTGYFRECVDLFW